jgi:SAM-dependent methyltransferase
MNYEIAEAIAPTWESRRADIEQISAPVREWMIRELLPQKDETLLELAAGTGDTGFEAAASIGERGLLYSTDFSPARAIDAERIELDDDAVDGVLCRFGYMLVADPAAALAETRRVVRPGGRLTLAVWGAPERTRFHRDRDQPRPSRPHAAARAPAGPRNFSMASAERTTALLEGAGFSEVRTEEVPVRFEIPDIDEYVAVVADTAGSIGLALRGLPGTERDAVRAEAEAALERFAGESGYEIPGVVLCAVAS